MAPPITPLVVRFWSRVNKDGPIHPVVGRCWQWTAGVSPSGYGKIGQGRAHGTVFVASRLSWEWHNGPIPAGIFVLHRCDNPRCVNPAHLFLGTHKDNMADMRAKGRAVSGMRTHPERAAKGNANGARKHPERVLRGEAHPNSTMTADIVRAIRSAVRAGEPKRTLARRMGINRSTVSNIASGRQWKHVV